MSLNNSYTSNLHLQNDQFLHAQPSGTITTSTRGYSHIWDREICVAG